MTRASRIRFPACVVLLGLCLSYATGAPAQSDDSPPQESSPGSPPLQLPPSTLTTLKNGTRLLLAPDPGAAVVTVATFYRVGSAHETQDEQGLARLMSAMMFRGSRNVPPGGHAAWVKRHGGTARALVTKDYSVYYQTLPAQHLQPVLWLEGERGTKLALNQENVKRQTSLLREESLALSSPSQIERLHQLVFQGYFPYEHSQSRAFAAKARFSLAQVQRFAQQHYGADTLLLVVAGQFERTTAQQWAARYFGELPASSRPEQLPLDTIPRQTSERFNAISAPGRNTPRVVAGWRIPGAGTRVHSALEASAAILAQGDSSLGYGALVTQKAVAQRVRAEVDGYFRSDLLTVTFDVSPNRTVDDGQNTLDKLIARLRRKGPSPSNVLRAKAQLRGKRLRELSNVQERALLIGRRTLAAQASENPPPTLQDLASEFDDLTASEIAEATRRYLTDTGRTIVEAYPSGWKRDLGPVLVTRSHVVKRGENLIRIARRYATSASRIATQNNIKVSTPIVPGQRLLITVGAGYRPPPKPITYVVVSGDNLISIASRHGVKLTALLQQNRLKRSSRIFPGQQLKIPAGGHRQKDSTKKLRQKTKTITHVVKSGENIIRIAKKYGVPARKLAIDNKLGSKRKIFPGQKLNVEVPLRRKPKPRRKK